MTRQPHVWQTRGEAQWQAEYWGGGNWGDTRKVGGNGEEGERFWEETLVTDTGWGEEGEFRVKRIWGLQTSFTGPGVGITYTTQAFPLLIFLLISKGKLVFKKKHLYLQIKTIVGSTAAKHYLRSPQGPGKTITLSGGEQVLFRDGVKRPMLILPKSTTGERLSSVSQAGSTGRSFTRQQAAPSHFTEQLSVWPPQGEVGALKGSNTLSLDLGSRTSWSLIFQESRRHYCLLGEALLGGMWQENLIRIYIAICDDVIWLQKDLRTSMQPENRSGVRTSHLSRGGRSWVSWQRNEKVWGWEDITAALNIWRTVKQDSVHGPKGRTRTDGVEVTDFSWKQERSAHNFIQVMADGRGGHLGLPSKSLMIDHFFKMCPWIVLLEK